MIDNIQKLKREIGYLNFIVTEDSIPIKKVELTGYEDLELLFKIYYDFYNIVRKYRPHTLDVVGLIYTNWQKDFIDKLQVFKEIEMLESLSEREKRI